MIRLLTAIAIAGAVLAAWLFPRAFPIVVLSNRVSREVALQRADSFARAHAMPAGARTAIQFTFDDSLHTFIDLAGGGRDSLEALVRGKDAAPYRWSVRAFSPNDVHETFVHMAADGRFIGFERKLAEADKRPTLDSAAANRVADEVLWKWLGEAPDRWYLAATSYVTQKASGRVDRTFKYERVNLHIAAAPIFLDIVIAGDTPTAARHFVDVPESFIRRYGEMRSSNELLSNAANVAMLALALAGALALRRYSREQRVRWRPALIVGGIIAALAGAEGLNELPSAWYGYDTAMAPAVFQALIFSAGIAGAVALGALVAVTLAAAESAARAAFPNQMDWWGLWRNRGTREVAVSVAGGYALAATGIAYVSAFYLVTRSLLGWWVPTEVLDDPNQIATSVPWLAGLAASLQAGVWEESLFRALPLSMLSMWVGDRPKRNAWMAGGVLVTALVFGFAHSNYPSWPAYSRGFEILVEASLWGFLFLRFGILMTVVAHFLFDMTLFGMFAAAGNTLPYIVASTIVALILLAPALAVAWKWLRQGGLEPAPAAALAGAWQPVEEAPREVPLATVASGVLSARARRAALWAAGVGVVATLVAPRPDVLGPRFTATRKRAMQVADSAMGSRGVDPTKWKQLATSASADSLSSWPRFLRREKSESLAQKLATTYAVPAWWIVRYVHIEGTVAQRTEEWRVRVRPDGVLIDVRHVIADSAAGKTLAANDARRIARAAMLKAGLDTTTMRELNLEETRRPARLDVKVTYNDTAMHMPADATARAWVSIAGDEPLVVRRGIDLPEKFLRDDRGDQTRRVVVAVIASLLLVTILIVGAILVVRRRTPIVDDLMLSGRARLGFFAGVAAIGVLTSLNDWPSATSQYDTAQPWSSFLMSSVLQSAAGAVFMALFFSGLWLLVESMRRRVGIPLWARGGEGRLSDGFVAGLGLCGASAATSLFTQAARMMNPVGIPTAPTATFTEAVPALTGVLGVPMNVVSMLPLVAIPLLMIVGLARKLPGRLALAAVMLALAGAAVAVARDTAPSAYTIAAQVATVIVLVLALRAWAATSVMTWVVAALASSTLSAIQDMVRANSATMLTATLLAGATAAALLYLIERTARGSGQAVPGLEPRAGS